MKALIVDNRITKKCERALEKEGFYLLKLPRDPSLEEAVASHPDTVLFYCAGEIITTVDYCESAAYFFTDIREYCPHVRLSFSDESRSDSYPSDCIMNALVIGRRIVCKSDSVSNAILNFAREGGYEVIHTNQGYPACSVLAFGNSAITADAGLAKVLEKNGVKVTLINQGGISLPPYDYGFIGGASGVVDNKIYFFGNLDLHPDAKVIRQAIEGEGYLAISLSDEELGDFGGIIPI